MLATKSAMKEIYVKHIAEKFGQICEEFINDSDAIVANENNWLHMMSQDYIVIGATSHAQVFNELRTALQTYIVAEKEYGFHLQVYSYVCSYMYDLYVTQSKGQNNIPIITISVRDLLGFDSNA